jgi:microcystin-dependent protein
MAGVNMSLIATLQSQASNAQTMPTGTILTFGGTTAPTGWNLCDGSALSTTTFANLFAVLGSTYNTASGNGAPGGGLFRVPDLRGRLPLGSGSGNSLTARARGDTLGTELESAELKTHTHTVIGNTGGVSANHTHATAPIINDVIASVVAGPDFVSNNSGQSAQTGTISADHSHGSNFASGGPSVGTGTSHNNIQPSLGINYIIKT